MNVYVIGSVRKASSNEEDKIAVHVAGLEKEGHQVCSPKRDILQNDPKYPSGYSIVFSELEALRKAQRVDILWNPDSEGSHVDFAMAFALLPFAALNLVDDPANKFLLRPEQRYYQTYLENQAKIIPELKRHGNHLDMEWLPDFLPQKPHSLEQERIEQRLLLGVALANLQRVGGLQLHVNFRGEVDHANKNYGWVLEEIMARQKKRIPLFD